MKKKSNNCECQICGRKYVWKGKGSGTKSTCNSCIVNKYKRIRKLMIVEYLGGSCKLCGYDKCPGVLSAHHTHDKVFTISGSHTRKWEVVAEELDKCELLCANCHQELHWKLDSK